MLFHQLPIKKPGRQPILLDPTDIDRLIVEGKRFHEIAQLYHCSPWTISEFARKHGIKNIFRRRRDDLDRIRLLAGEGLTPKAIGETIGIAGQTVQAIMQKNGVENTSEHSRLKRIRDTEKDAIIKMVAANLTEAEIGSIYGITQSVISRWLKRWDIPASCGRGRRRVAGAKSTK